MTARPTAKPKTRVIYPESFKTQVISEWVLGASVYSLAIKHDMPKTTLHDWVDSLERPTPVLTGRTREEFEGKLAEATIALLEGVIALGRQMAAHPVEPTHEHYSERLAELVRNVAVLGGAVRLRDTSGPGPAQLEGPVGSATVTS